MLNNVSRINIILSLGFNPVIPRNTSAEGQQLILIGFCQNPPSGILKSNVIFQLETIQILYWATTAPPQSVFNADIVFYNTPSGENDLTASGFGLEDKAGTIKLLFCLSVFQQRCQRSFFFETSNYLVFEEGF